MNLRKIECFLVLSNELHFGKAAEKLHMAQPPLSRVIKELESELNVILFTRSSRSVELTKAGHFLRDEAKKVFSHLDQIKEQLKLIEQGKIGKLKIGYVGAAMHSVLPGILVKIKKDFDIHIALAELKNEEQVDALIAGQIDIGFVRSVPEREGVLSVKVFSESFSLILPINHPLAKRKKINLMEFVNEPFIGLNYDCAPRLSDSIFEICRKSGLKPKVAHETSQINSIVRLVESGLGYSIVPTSVKTGYSLNVKFFELNRFSEKAKLFLMYKKESDPLVKQVIDVVKRFIQI
jgi:DNA-binding transcriptional LysR family regulator